jgi:uncharacterized membrane protein YgcG
MGIAFACSSDPAPIPAGFDGPACTFIAKISLGEGNVLERKQDPAVVGSCKPVDETASGSTALACDHTIGIEVHIENWDLRQPGACPVTQCGRLRIELSDSTHDKPLITQEFASTGISLDLSSLFPAGGEPQLAAGTYTLSAALIDDAGNPYNAGDLSTGSAQESFQLDLPTNCPIDGSAGTAGSGAVAEGGAAGLAGRAGASDSAGAAGEAARGSGGTSGSGGSSGSAGSSGSGGTSGSSGSGGTSGAPAMAGAAGE